MKSRSGKPNVLRSVYEVQPESESEDEEEGDELLVRTLPPTLEQIEQAWAEEVEVGKRERGKYTLNV